MRIGELAQQAGLKTSAIRFYEASGLLPAGLRGLNGYRDYGDDALQRLQFIQLAQRLGFSLDVLRQLFTEREATGALPQAQILAGLARRRAEIAQLRAELDAQDAELQRLSLACQEGWARGDCAEKDVLAHTVRPARQAAPRSAAR